MSGQRKDRLREGERLAPGCPASGAYSCKACVWQKGKAGRQDSTGQAPRGGVSGKPGTPLMRKKGASLTASGWPLEGSGHTSVCMSSFLQGFQPGPRTSSRGPDLGHCPLDRSPRPCDGWSDGLDHVAILGAGQLRSRDLRRAGDRAGVGTTEVRSPEVGVWIQWSQGCPGSKPTKWEGCASGASLPLGHCGPETPRGRPDHTEDDLPPVWSPCAREAG